ncbi:MAG: hypothetical protein H7X86_06725 [Gorillibacterium sp.]|nr:hypothetical protein [Gorillibacterium sp.]
MRKAASLIGFSILTGALMSCYLIIPGTIKFLFSILSLYLGYQFFRRAEGWGLRIGFIVLSVILALIFTVIYTGLAIKNGWYINPSYLEGV